MIKTCASFPVLAYSFHLYILKNSLPFSLLRKIGFFPSRLLGLFVLMPPLSLCSSSSQTPSAAGDHHGLLSALPTLKSLACQVSRDSRYVRKKERQKVWNFVVGMCMGYYIISISNSLILSKIMFDCMYVKRGRLARLVQLQLLILSENLKKPCQTGIFLNRFSCGAERSGVVFVKKGGS